VCILLYVVLYCMFYKRTHLRREPVTGDVYVDGWLPKFKTTTDVFSNLGYCSAQIQSADVQAGSCVKAIRQTAIDERSSPHTLFPGQSVIAAAAPEEVDGYMMLKIQPTGMVYLKDVQLCGAGSATTRRCGYVNDVDLHSFKGGNFIPTFVQVVHQKASCVDGSENIKTCQLDYKTTADYEQQLDEFFIGSIEQYQVQFTHTFESDTLGQRQMDQAEHFGIPSCAISMLYPFCYDASDGGHDMTSIGLLVGLIGQNLSNNNAETDHVGRRETFRTSGMKLHVQVKYSNLEDFWSWTGSGTVGYTYEVEQVPAESVWRSKTITRKEEMRAWVNGDMLVNFGDHDRMLIWADGIEIRAHVSGHFGQLDLSSLLVLLASAGPLLFFSGALVSCMVGVEEGVDEDLDLGLPCSSDTYEGSGMSRMPLSGDSGSTGARGGDDAL